MVDSYFPLFHGYLIDKDMAITAGAEVPVGKFAEGLGFDADVTAMSRFVNVELLYLRLIVFGIHQVDVSAIRLEVHVVF